jgi:hypothetical protein
VKDIEKPDQVIFDLDPDEALPFSRVAAGARRVRALLQEGGLESFVKTTGGKGRIFVDYLRNVRGANAVGAYSTRAREGAPVSVPPRDLSRDGQGVLDRERAVREAQGEVLAGDELHRQEVRRAAVRQRRRLEAVEVGDPLVIERSQHLRLALEPREPVGIRGESRRQQLDRGFAPEPCVPGSEDLAHPAGAQRSDDLVLAELLAGGEAQAVGSGRHRSTCPRASSG